MAYGPDLTPLIAAYNNYSKSVEDQATRSFAASSDLVKTSAATVGSLRNWRREDEREALLKGTELKTPMGNMSAYTLAKLGGGSAFEAVRSMVLTKAAIDEQAYRETLRDYLKLKMQEMRGELLNQARGELAHTAQTLATVVPAPGATQPEQNPNAEGLADLRRQLSKNAAIAMQPVPGTKMHSMTAEERDIGATVAAAGIVTGARVGGANAADPVSLVPRGQAPWQAARPSDDAEPVAMEPGAVRRYARPGERVIGAHFVRTKDGSLVYNPAGTLGNAVPRR